ncbi:MAG: DUF4386 domain-containing protein [Ignavibacteriae bacterium]|nr:DUF4386 domain-containing protein [Ignavibacteriota bacterium]MCB9260746.1 DUF4386 domain-containing protein [Ignavibacteriales bacterium]
MESMKNILRLSGLGYLVIFLTGFFSNFYVLENLFVLGNAEATLNNIIENEMLFRYGIAGFILMVIFDLLLAWTFYILFRQVSDKLSLLSSWLRLVNAAIFGVALFKLINVLQIITDSNYKNIFDKNIKEAQIMISYLDFNNIWLIGLLFFGLHLLLLGYLIYKSKFIPKFIGILLFIAGLGYLVDSFAHFLLANYDSYKEIFELIVILPGVIGELSFTIWLLINGFFIRKKNT